MFMQLLKGLNFLHFSVRCLKKIVFGNDPTVDSDLEIILVISARYTENSLTHI